MNKVEEIKAPIAEELETFNKVFSSAFNGTGGLLNSILLHLHKERGKQIRPILLLLSAKLCGAVTPESYLTASAFETLHTASLIHDDVVDNTFQRRNQPSVNALYDNKASVLIGDYLLTLAMDFISRTRNFDLADCFVSIGKELAKGELLQLEMAFQEASERVYFDVIQKKTAILFAQCAKGGAISVNASKEEQQKLFDFGNYLGICFQIKDDIFDYTRKADIGKPTFNDIREGKITLPLIRTLELATEEERNFVYQTMKEQHFDNEHLDQIQNYIERYEGIAYAMGCMEHYKQKAFKELASFKDSETKLALILLLDHVLDRTK